MLGRGARHQPDLQGPGRAVEEGHEALVAEHAGISRPVGPHERVRPVLYDRVGDVDLDFAEKLVVAGDFAWVFADDEDEVCKAALVDMYFSPRRGLQNLHVPSKYLFSVGM